MERGEKSTRRGANAAKSARRLLQICLKKRESSGRMVQTSIQQAIDLNRGEKTAPCNRQTQTKANAKQPASAVSARGFSPRRLRAPAPKGCPPCECECTLSKRMRRRLPSTRGEYRLIPRPGRAVAPACREKICVCSVRNIK